MCCCSRWWCLRVCTEVFGNLTRRFFDELLDAIYGMCSLCCCGAKGAAAAEICDASKFIGLESEMKEDFCKDVDRETSEELLKSRQNGTFIIRPSKNSNIGTLSVVQNGRVFHLNIRRRNDDLFALGNEKANEKCFRSLNGLINYYISNYLILYSNGEKFHCLLLPYKGNDGNV